MTYDAKIESAECEERIALSRALTYRMHADATFDPRDRAYYLELARTQETVATTQRHIIASLITLRDFNRRLLQPRTPFDE